MLSGNVICIEDLLKDRIKNLHIKQREAAVMMGLSEGTVSRYLRGKGGRPHILTATKLGEFLGIDPLLLMRR